jgi:hypothetical protein
MLSVQNCYLHPLITVEKANEAKKIFKKQKSKKAKKAQKV